MVKELYTAALGMLSQQTRLEVTANNLSNANTTGFKRSSVFERNLIDARSHFFNIPGDAEQNDPPLGSYTVFTPGSFLQTNNPLDIAIEGKNLFFMVQDNEGKNYLTKSGKFTLSSDGKIVTPDGKNLLGKDGIIKINKTSGQDLNEDKSLNIHISNNGEIFVNDKQIGTIQLAKIKDLKELKKADGSNFNPSDNIEIEEADANESVVKQGWIESSNVDIVKEMVEMLELQRMFELGNKVIHTNNETIEQSIRIGKFY